MALRLLVSPQKMPAGRNQSDRGAYKNSPAAAL